MIIDKNRKSNEEIIGIMNTYGNTLFKICLVMLCNESDAEDAVQNTILKYISKSPTFKDDEHEKAWLIRVATNICIDMHRFRKRNTHINIEDLAEYYHSEEDEKILNVIMELPKIYKVVIYLYYVAGYKTDEIAGILKILPTTVRKRLQYGRNILKIEYKEELDNGRKTIDKCY